MTVLMRDELNEADLAWANADPVLPPLAVPMIEAGRWPVEPWPRERRVVEPAAAASRGRASAAGTRARRSSSGSC